MKMRKIIMGIYLVALLLCSVYLPFVVCTYSGSGYGRGDLSGSIDGALDISGDIDMRYDSDMRKYVLARGYDWSFKPDHQLKYIKNNKPLKINKSAFYEIDIIRLLQEYSIVTFVAGFALLIMKNDK